MITFTRETSNKFARDILSPYMYQPLHPLFGWKIATCAISIPQKGRRLILVLQSYCLDIGLELSKNSARARLADGDVGS